MLAVPLNGVILRLLSTGPRRQGELRREAGSPAQGALRSHLKALEALGAIVRHRRGAFPGSAEYELAEAGRELRFVLLAVERWLAEAPEGPLGLREDAARAAIETLVEGWSSTLMRALAAGPLSLAELDGLVGTLDRPSLERQLEAMRLRGMVAAAPANGRGTPYAVTDWLRRGVAPIAAASRWEQRNAADGTAQIGRIDAEAGLMLAMPMARLPPTASGSCRLVVEFSGGAEVRPAAVTVAANDGRVLSCVAGSEDADAWAVGPPSAWFRTAIEADPNHLELGGDSRLARALLEGLFSALFSAGALPSAGFP
jgi:DNA-binding HxlR family transcriptional regulator